MTEDDESYIAVDIEVDTEGEKLWIGYIKCPGDYAHELPSTLRKIADAAEAQMREAGWIE